ncbi:MAG TPA: YraN family protein [Acidobacteriaceae bacterium]|nr:YraN family protein [Acidobacteriaceae bacterium]
MQISRFAEHRLAVVERTLGWLEHHAMRRGTLPKQAAHLAIGLRGEDAAYFYLRRLGYTVIARRWRSAKLRGDIDLIGWDDEHLCFVEVKTRTSRSFQPAEVAVDREKRAMLMRMAQEYMRQLENRDRIPIRFDVLSVYLADVSPEFELFRGAFNSE